MSPHIKPPKIFGITGGIAAGKTFFCRLLERHNIPVYYCDEAAKELMVTDEQLNVSLRHLLGAATYLSDGSLNKAHIAAYLQENGPERINALVHPCVRRHFLQWAATQTAPIIAIESAILFESQLDDLVDTVIFISAPEALRINRLMQRNGCSATEARQWLDLQMDEERKKKLSDIVILNDGTTDLEKQVTLLLEEEKN